MSSLDGTASRGRGDTSARRRLRRLWGEHRWLAISLLGLIALVLGIAGGPRGTFLDRLYTAIQLFVLNGSTAGDESTAFEIARFLAPAIFLYATLRAIYALFQERLHGVRAGLRRNHIVVCGLGRQGQALVRTFSDTHDIVAIELDPANPGVQLARDAGAVVLIADATEPDVLRKARVDRAARVVAVCGRDAVNAQIAIRLSEAVGRRSTPLPALVHLEDPRLYELVVYRTASDSSVWVEFFNIFDRGARALLEECRPDGGVRARHLLVVGLGRLGQAVVARAAQERAEQLETAGERLRVTAIDREARVRALALEERYSRLREVCELVPLELEAESPGFDHLLEGASLDDVDAAYVCFDDDARSVVATLSLARQARARFPIVVARVADPEGGLALLLRDYDDLSGGAVRVLPVSLAERTSREDIVRLGVLDLLAREVHESYLRSGTTGPAARPWDELSAAERDHNVAHAAAVKAQLEAVDYRLGPMFDWGAPLVRPTAEENERMAELEHERWASDRTSAGWRFGERRDDERKLHPDLVPWERLPEARRQIDRDLVNERAAMLARVGIALYRARGRHASSA